MLPWFRARLGPIASALLVSLVTLGGVSSASHGLDCHEDECAAIGAHDASAHRFEAGSTAADHSLHCVLCHWTRSVRPEAETLHHLLPPTPGTVHLHADVPPIVPSTYGPQPPLRSPPSFALFA